MYIWITAPALRFFPLTPTADVGITGDDNRHSQVEKQHTHNLPPSPAPWHTRSSTSTFLAYVPDI